MKLFYVIISVLLLNTFVVACGQSSGEKQEVRTFDMKNFTSAKLPENLREISGITLHPSSLASLLAVEDETGTIYTILESGEIVAQSNFAAKGDYEGIATSADMIYVLRSDGVIYAIPSKDLGELTKDAIKTYDIFPKGEYESIAYDKESKSLVVLPKEMKSDDKQQVTSVFIVSVSVEGLNLQETKYIKTSQIAEHLRLKGPFRPSALAKDPKTSEWYVIASINKILLGLDAEWNVIEAIKLDKKVFPQPEGMVFDRDGDLLISNEGGKTGAGTIVKVPRR